MSEQRTPVREKNNLSCVQLNSRTVSCSRQFSCIIFNKFFYFELHIQTLSFVASFGGSGCGCWRRRCFYSRRWPAGPSTWWRRMCSSSPCPGPGTRGFILDSVPNPDPDPRVFWPPGSGSTCQRYKSGSVSGSRSGFFYPHAKIIRKILSPTILWLFLTFYVWKII